MEIYNKDIENFQKYYIIRSYFIILNISFCRNQEKPPLWDSFQDPPPQKETGSSATWSKLNFFLKLFKFLIYIFVFCSILLCTILSKSLFLLMASNIRARNCTYCMSRGLYTLKSIFKIYKIFFF